MEGRYKTYEEFWPFYVSEHRHPSTRRLHFVGSNLGLGCLAAAVVHSPWWLLAGLVAGYGCAWAGHFFFEKNRPATFSYPLWSLRGDGRMLRLMWSGRMEAEIARLTAPGPASAR